MLNPTTDRLNVARQSCLSHVSTGVKSYSGVDSEIRAVDDEDADLLIKVALARCGLRPHPSVA